MTQEEAERIMQKVEAILREEQRKTVEAWALVNDGKVNVLYYTRENAEDALALITERSGWRIVHLKEVL